MGLGPVDIDIPSMLLTVGFLTTPASATGVSLSEFWAYVRYLAAMTNDSDLRLSRAFADLDAHQKTILSDDFGMGVPMNWLTSALDLHDICDGRYFVDRFAARVGAHSAKSAKRGPSKTPDFVARDGRGVWHVIECKGTQSGGTYQARQIGEAGPPPTGGIAQKRSLVFPKGYSGQRLVCALSIAVEGGAGSSRLRIVDPEPEDPIVVEASQIAFAVDAGERSTVARALRLAGFEATADVTAAPWGRYAWSRPTTDRRSEELRAKDVEARQDAARAELADDDRISWNSGGDRYIGREVTIPLPREIKIDGERVRRVYLRQGVNSDVLGELRNRPTVEDQLDGSETEWEAAIGKTRTTSDGNNAQLMVGQLFRSEMRLES